MQGLILPVHKSLGEMAYSYDDVEFPDQGITNLVKYLKTPIIEVVNGYKHTFWKNNVDWNDRPSDFLTVAAKLSHTTYLRKGYDLILDLATRLPNKSFTLIGTFPKIRSIPPNVTLISNMDQKGLLHIYNHHKYYFQLSMFEGFSNALCESMLCGCIPIGSSVARIPDIIDESLQ
jgi:glycosyltransferase involved in cell wall biosynthesis